MKKTQITGRSKPTQERAKDSVDTILATTARLLDEVGIEAFNTNLLAERANVRVRTIYRYFPNKYAVIAALTEMLAVKWEEWNEPYYRVLADPQADWKKGLRDKRIQWQKNATRTPGSLSVLKAMNATPQLQELHSRIFEAMSEKTAAALRARGLPLPPARLRAIARALVNVTNARTDLYIRLRGKEAQLFVTELDRSIELYLQHYLES